MIETLAAWLYVLALVAPPAAVILGVLMLLKPSTPQHAGAVHAPHAIM